ncbi:MAG: hypothetical protein ACK4RK_08845 [Gemmataceae bacterium]
MAKQHNPADKHPHDDDRDPLAFWQNEGEESSLTPEADSADDASLPVDQREELINFEELEQVSEELLDEASLEEGAEPESGGSLTSWSDLVETDVPSESSAVDLGGGPLVHFDALSDADIIEQFAEEEDVEPSDIVEAEQGVAAVSDASIDLDELARLQAEHFQSDEDVPPVAAAPERSAKPPVPSSPKATQLAQHLPRPTMLAPAEELSAEVGASAGKILNELEGTDAILWANAEKERAADEPDSAEEPDALTGSRAEQGRHAAAAEDAGAVAGPESTAIDLLSDPLLDVTQELNAPGASSPARGQEGATEEVDLLGTAPADIAGRTAKDASGIDLSSYPDLDVSPDMDDALAAAIHQEEGEILNFDLSDRREPEASGIDLDSDPIVDVSALDELDVYSSSAELARIVPEDAASRQDSSSIDLDSDPTVDVPSGVEGLADAEPTLEDLMAESDQLYADRTETSEVDLSSDPELPSAIRHELDAAVEEGMETPLAEADQEAESAETVEWDAAAADQLLAESEKAAPDAESSAINLGEEVEETAALFEMEQLAEEAAVEEAPAEEAAAELPDVEAPGETQAAATEEGEATVPMMDGDIDWDNLGAAEAEGEAAAGGEEQGVSADVEEEAVEEAAVEAEEEKYQPSTKGQPAKMAKPRYGRRWAGGMFVGGLVGTAASLALWLTGYTPPLSWRGDVNKFLQSNLGMSLPMNPAAEEAGSLQMALQHLDSGNLNKALPMLEQASEPETPDLLAARGQTRWLLYLQRQNGNQLKKDDPAVQQAIADLTKANNPQGLFWLGHIDEMIGDVTAARAAYLKGRDAANNNPVQQKMFDAALNRLDARPTAAAPPMEPAADAGAARSDASAALMVWMVTLLQNDAAAPADEAGFKFWEAAKLARQHQFDAARKALQEARAVHEKQRFVRLNKAQNPTSDPTEEIFLRACEDLLAFWALQEKLNASGYDLAKYPSANQALDALLKDKDQSKETVAKALQAFAEKLEVKDDQATADDLLKTLDGLILARKNADMQLTALQKDLTEAKFVTPEQQDLVKGLQTLIQDWKETTAARKDADDKLTKVSDQLKAAGVMAPELDKAVQQLAATRDDLNQTVRLVIQKLEAADMLPPKADRAQLGQTMDKLIAESGTPLVSALNRLAGDLSGLGNVGGGVAQALDLSGRLAASEAQNASYEALFIRSRTPEAMLAFWVNVLQNGDRANDDNQKKAALDAEWVIKDEKASPAVKAQARAVQGLILRNQNQLAEARQALQEALPNLNDNRLDNVLPLVQAALRELNDPEVYLRPANALYQAGDLEGALRELNKGLDILPEKDGNLLALRSIVQLDKARDQGRRTIGPDHPAVAAIRQDAEAAVAAGAVAEGNYASARLAEELADFAAAEKLYREAIKAAGDANMDGMTLSRYKLGLARVLLQPRQPRPAVPVPANVPAARRSERPGTPVSDARQIALVLAVTALQIDDDQAPPPKPEEVEAQRLAEEAIKAGNPEGYLILAQVLAKQGYWTQALQEYVKGLNQLIKPEYADGLQMIIDNHPAFKRPDGLRYPDTALAEKHFASGLRHYYSRRYEEAEKDFLEAIRYFDQDARYLYFLGLARLPQGKVQEAREDFRFGGLLERQNRPTSAAVSVSLERVQGSVRQTLNNYRP